MNIATQPWFWTAVVSGLVLVGLFFFAYYTHKKKEILYKKVMEPIAKKGPPPNPSDLAAFTLLGKRAFRASNFFCTLALAYFRGG